MAKKGPPLQDLIGQKFGKLTVADFAGIKKGRAYWRCICECGGEKVVIGQSLKNGDTSSCGCDMTVKKRIALFGAADLTGKRFGSLTVIRPKDIRSWYCRCDCGREMSRATAQLHGSVALKCKVCAAADRRMDLTGKRFGRLVAIEIEERENIPHKNRVHWRCKCDCGNVVSVVSSFLIAGQTQSCGCINRERASRMGIEHGRHNALGKCRHKYDWYVVVNRKRITLRSSYEVIFAKYLLKHRIRFEYEPQVFRLDACTAYVPDFYLPDTDTWVEVKGYVSDDWKRKRVMFERTGKRLLVVTEASLSTYMDGKSYTTWMRENGHKYFRSQ